MGERPEYRAAAEAVGHGLALRGVGLVYGGAHRGLMGVVADSALAAGGEAMGVIPQSMVAEEIAHAGLTQLHVVATMHERKALMASNADAFLTLPGGMGTWEELCEVLAWSQLRIHQKPCAVLNTGGYYDPLLAMMDRAVAEGFLPRQYREALICESTAEAVLDRLVDAMR
jgi:uncharacterized protein (TIGR00730 family)